MKFMCENNHSWVGLSEAALFITEFANESLREQNGDEVDSVGQNLSFAEMQRCFLPCESAELRAELS